MRSAEPQGLDAHETAPAGHDNGGVHLRARIVSEAALAIVDKERAALDDQAGVVGLRRDDARLYRKAREKKLFHMTGIDSPYERPEQAEVHLQGGLGTSPEAMAETVIAELMRRDICG